MNISETTLIIRTVALVILSFATIHKLWVMQQNTKEWNKLTAMAKFSESLL